MTELVVVVPSRGRPASAERLTRAFEATCASRTRLVFVVDDDDPTLAEYSEVSGRRVVDEFSVSVCRVPPPPVRGMVVGLNAVVAQVADQPGFAGAVGFMGDDHLPVTEGWDAAYLAELAELGTGIVYGDDRVQGERLPTQVAMTADIVRALGWMCPPCLRHLFVDDFWRDLGQRAGCLRYLPDVVIEHLHPAAGTAEMDDGYRTVNSSLSYALDRGAYDHFCRSGGLAAAVEAVRALRGGAGG